MEIKCRSRRVKVDVPVNEGLLQDLSFPRSRVEQNRYGFGKTPAALWLTSAMMACAVTERMALTLSYSAIHR